MLRWRAVFVVILCVAVLFTTGASSGPTTPTYNHFAYLPMVSGWFYGVSRYMSSLSVNSTYYNEGCAQGQITPSGINAFVVLDFGYPGQNGAYYGAWYLPNGNVFVSTGGIESLVEQYMIGFHDCSPAQAQLTLAVGTVNSGAGLTTGQAQAWAYMINDLWTWINTPPSYADKISVAGGIDIEPGFGPAAAARAWVDSYAQNFTGMSFLYNYGTCDGCPLQWCPTCTAGTINYTWTLDDIYHVAYGALPSYPTPEIYLTNGWNATQWYWMSRYSWVYHVVAINFKATMTQWGACHYDGNLPTCIVAGTLNTPYAGWSQLYGDVNADPNTQQAPGWSTDITWQN
jgi:hypothetical protein